MNLFFCSFVYSDMIAMCINHASSLESELIVAKRLTGTSAIIWMERTKKFLPTRPEYEEALAVRLGAGPPKANRSCQPCWLALRVVSV
jgi:hypothetical protein